MTKWKSNLKSINNQHVSSYYGKNILNNSNSNIESNSENDSNAYE